ncbi:MAG: AAA family ATPase [Planctomycetes bacterium]|nr:AAA family ATPase [Planctomycetota bacterium]
MKTHRLNRIDIEGFRSLRKQTWHPGELNVLIGPNASGKSNLLRALQMVSFAATGKLGEFVQQEGGMAPICWNRNSKSVRVALELRTDGHEQGDSDALSYEFTLSRVGSTAYQIGDEQLTESLFQDGTQVRAECLLRRAPESAELFSTEHGHFVSPKDLPNAQETFLSMISDAFAVNPNVAEFRVLLSQWKIFEPFRTDRAATVREPQVARVSHHVGPWGQNLPRVLHTLCNSSRDFEEGINQAMQAAFGEEFEKLVFPPAADQRIQLGIRWKSLGNYSLASELSDGTLRFLYLVAVLVDPNPLPLIVIDEPELGLHPSMLPIVAELAVDAATRSQIVFTTHSTDFLDAFPRDSAPKVTVVKLVNGETELHIPDADELKHWLQEYNLGELHRSHQLDTMV